MSTPGTVNYPTSVDDAVSLLEATNGASTTLAAPLTDVATAASVVSAALFPTTGAVVFNGVEIAYYTGKTSNSLTGLIRGRDGTTAVAHAAGVGVQGRIIARHHTVLSEAIRATQSALNADVTSLSASIAALASGKANAASSLAGYGILDAFTKTESDGRYSQLGHVHPFSSLTGKPSTIGGYGITDFNSLGDARFAALIHAHALADITGLISGGKIASGLLPSLAITDTSVVASQAAMLALTAETGDVAVRSDQSKTYILKGTNPAVLADWELLQTPTDAVLSVNGQTGVVSLTSADVGALAVAATAAAATKLATSRTINGVAFDGTANITVAAAAGTLTGATLAAGVTASSLTSVGTLAALTVTAAIVGSVSGNAATATALATTRAINGVSFDGTAAITVTAAASTLTGTALNATVVTSSLTALGTIATGVWNGTTIAIANGGTGQTTAANAINALLPAQTGNSGKYLTTDGTNSSWATVSASDATKLPLAGGTMTGALQFSPVSYTAGLGSPGGGILGMALQRGGLAYFNLHTSGLWAGLLHLSSTFAGKGIAWSTDSFDNTADTLSIETAIMQTSAGRLQICNGTKSTMRDLDVRSLFAVASSTSQASLNVPHGSAPTSPVNGDIWTTTAGLFVRVNGATIGPLS